MDMMTVNEVLGLASSAVGLTGKAASTITAVKSLFDAGKTGDNSNSAEASKMLNELANELTAVNVMNFQLSQALRALSGQIQAQEELSRERARYALHETSAGDMVLKLKEEAANGDPMHYVCPVCFNKSGLISYVTGRGYLWHCQTENSHMFKFGNTPR